MIDTATCWGTSSATGTGWYGDPFQQMPATDPASPQSRVRARIFFSETSTARESRRSRVCWPVSLILCSIVRSTLTTHEVRFATNGRPMSSMIRPRAGCTTSSRIDCSAACAWYASPPSTCMYHSRANSVTNSVSTSACTTTSRSLPFTAAELLETISTRPGGAACGGTAASGQEARTA
jgi:hypothetical protein